MLKTFLHTIALIAIAYIIYSFITSLMAYMFRLGYNQAVADWIQAGICILS